MKAIVQDTYGSPAEVLELQDISKPVVKDGEVLVRVHAASIHIGDLITMRGVPYVMRVVTGLRKPKNRVPGTDIAGTVEAVGQNVTRFRPGDVVFGWCAGAFAEYACAGEDHFAPKPSNLTFEQAAAVGVSATTALQLLREQGKVKQGQKVLINGASGGVGTFAVQIAKLYGAEVTGVCSTSNLGLVRSLGADKVVDYTKQDFTQNGETYDVILDMVPGETAFARYQVSLKPNGLYLAGAGGLKAFGQMAWTSLTGGKKVLAGMAPDRREDLVFLNELLETGKIKPVIDRRYPLEQTAEAHRYVDTGRKRGSVVITIAAQE
jgi:NADPH:quinone reductase-like Zn-dependent oxidoreductase